MRISVVLPAFNEEGNIGRLIEETFQVVPEPVLGEVVVVDDCSDDNTRNDILRLISTYPKLRYLRHDLRSGQSASLRSGVFAASFPIIATMDGDGQNDPADLINLVNALGKPDMAGNITGPTLVGGVRAKRKATGSRRFASRAANWIRDAILRDNCPDSGCGIKVYWRDAYLKLPFFTSMHRYMPALFQMYGHKVAYVDVNDRPRIAGQSKYTNFGRALIGIYDLIGITWLRKRTKCPGVAEDSAQASDSSKSDNNKNDKILHFSDLKNLETKTGN